MKHLDNERGYALFLAVLIIVLFGVLTISLLTIVLSGTNKTAIREDITQASELSEKGLQHIVSQINNELQTKIGENGISRTHFVDELEAVLNMYLCDNYLIEKENKTGDYFACIKDWKDGQGENGKLRKEVTFHSKGIVNGTEKYVESIIKIGADDVPDALKYALGSHKTCTGRNCLPAEGNLFLHGGVSIEGDMKVDGNIITTDRGYAYLNGDKWIESYFPSAKPGPNTNISKLVLGGSVYTFSNRPSYQDHITRNNFSSGYTKQSNLNHAFTDVPQLVSREPKRERIEITEQREKFAFNSNSPNVTEVSKESFNEGNKYYNSKVFAYSESCYFWYCDEINTYKINGNNTFGQFATQQNLEIKGSKSNFSTTSINNGMYIGKNLTIGNQSNSYNPSDYEKIKMDGPIFVNGNLTIKGADAQLNTLIYVNGNVTIENTRINGLNVNGKEGSLIIFANGKIKISNNSVNQDNPSNIRGYFYSEDVLEMFGVGSNLRIEGGISARRIVLNAIKGRANNQNFQGAQRITSNEYFEGKIGQLNRPSRLQIIYNPEIINTYSDLKQQEPVIYHIDPPQLIDRK